MIEPSVESRINDVKGGAKPASPAKIYLRLVGYAWNYKARLLTSLFFAIIIAASFGTLLVSVGTVINITFYEAPDNTTPGAHVSSSPGAHVSSRAGDDNATPGAHVSSSPGAHVSSRAGDDNATPGAHVSSRAGDDNATPGAHVSARAGDPAPEQEIEPDPAEEIASRIAAASAFLREYTGWAPEGIAPGFRNLVARMRDDQMRTLVVLSVIIVSLSFIIGITRFLQEYFAQSVGAAITTDLGRIMYANLMRQSLKFFERHTTGEILSRFTNDIFMVNRGLAGVFVKVMREPIKALTFLAIAIAVDPMLTLVGVAVLPPVLYILVWIGKKVRRTVTRSLEKVASMASVVNETVKGIAIVKAYNMEEYEIGRVQREIMKLRHFLFQMVKLNSATGPISEFLLVLGVVAFVLISGQRVKAGLLDPGDLARLYLAIAMMIDPIRKLSDVNNMIQTSVASAQRVFEFVDMKPDMEEAENPVELPPLQDRIAFENVHFSYDGETDVLRGVNIEVRKGEMVALVGFSGAGKSTLVKLIPRFYDVTAGAVSIDGIDIRQASYESLRRQIGMVTQDTVLFTESVRENIAFGKKDFPEDRIREAAEAAHAIEFIEKLPQGFDTMLGESGGNLSGGQRQRMAIARAIVKDPAILILDEATSSLDSESERFIQAALNEFVTGRTSLVIAHRLSTIQRADRILVIDGGIVAEEGTHQELLGKGGIYTRLYETQFGNRAEK
jgi:ATP-binding cassette, subfamily B, bacterial MsbA